MRFAGAILCALSIVVLCGPGVARADECPGNPSALGTSRTIVVDPTEHPRIGTMQYPQTLPLADHEVVLTFDDGPLPPYTKEVLNILAAQCVKATYFLVGRMAQAYPALVREIHAAGHTIGTHSQNHPLSFQRMAQERVAQEVDGGIESVKAALGEEGGLAPFFRIPGLLRADAVETFLQSHELQTWSADFPADDWKHISAKEITRRALMRLERHGKGVLLLHDIHRATVMALPTLLRELKARGYRVVHVVAATPDLPKTPTEVAQWSMRPSAGNALFRFAVDAGAAAPELVAPSPASFGLTEPFAARLGRGRGRKQALVPISVWPRAAQAAAQSSAVMLPVPVLQSFALFDALFDAPSARAQRPVRAEPRPALRPTRADGRPGRRAEVRHAVHRVRSAAPAPQRTWFQ